MSLLGDTISMKKESENTSMAMFIEMKKRF